MPDTLIVLIGPTGVGKTELSLSIAEHFRTSIVSADSRQLIDERALELVATDYLSIGDYVLTGGELPAMVMIDRADGRSLNGIPSVHQSHIGRLLLHLLFVERQPGITDVVVHPAVHIIGIQNHNVMIDQGGQDPLQ